jgi:hypothetical protein
MSSLFGGVEVRIGARLYRHIHPALFWLHVSANLTFLKAERVRIRDSIAPVCHSPFKSIKAEYKAPGGGVTVARVHCCPSRLLSVLLSMLYPVMRVDPSQERPQGQWGHASGCEALGAASTRECGDEANMHMRRSPPAAARRVVWEGVLSMAMLAWIPTIRRSQGM